MGQSVGSILEITVEWTAFAQKALNVLHYKVETESSTTGVVSETIEAANAFLSPGALGETLLDAIPTNVTMANVYAQFIRGTGAQRFARQVVDGLGAGVFTGTALTLNVAATFTKRTTFSGRWAVGSLHLPGVPSIAMDNGVISDAGYENELDDIKVQMLEPLEGAIGGGVYVPVILHPVGEHGGSTELFAVDWQPEVRTMRTRTIGKGV
jgi:hypothetical protein